MICSDDGSTDGLTDGSDDGNATGVVEYTTLGATDGNKLGRRPTAMTIADSWVSDLALD